VKHDIPPPVRSDHRFLLLLLQSYRQHFCEGRLDATAVAITIALIAEFGKIGLDGVGVIDAKGASGAF